MPMLHLQAPAVRVLAPGPPVAYQQKVRGGAGSSALPLLVHGCISRQSGLCD